MNNIPEDVKTKIIAIIKSCKTNEQLTNAKNYVNLVEKKYANGKIVKFENILIHSWVAFVRGFIEGMIVGKYDNI